MKAKGVRGKPDNSMSKDSLEDSELPPFKIYTL